MHDLHQPMGSAMSGLQRPVEPQGTPGTARAGPASHSDAPLRCFLVEDNPVIRQNLIATLEEMLAVEVIGTAEDEPAAVQWMRTPGETADLMIVDIFLKSGTGLGVLARARELCPHTRLVVLSNYATPDMRRRCLAMGAERVFDKSEELEEMLDYCAELAEH